MNPLSGLTSVPRVVNNLPRVGFKFFFIYFSFYCLNRFINNLFVFVFFFCFFVFFTFVHVFVVIEFIVFWFFLFLLSLFVCFVFCCCCYSVLHMVNVLLFTFSPILVFFYECFNVSSLSFSLFVRYVFTLACLCMFNRVSSCITRVYHLLYHYYSSYYRFVCYVLCLCLCSLCFTFTFIEQILLFVLTT